MGIWFLRSLAKIGAPKIWILGMNDLAKLDQIWEWLYGYREQWWAVGVRGPLKILVTGPILLIKCYFENSFHKQSGCNHVLRTCSLYEDITDTALVRELKPVFLLT